ncbi:SMC-Scp complex subunit ScpB [Gimesia fumaroli]|uniref:Segregation and condensation protein B n=1 Tax=Gimesia fumaroli TaxID=2527976 RepID=A0A518I655_9PLAN|nr:SMC-Scp complex subunit ScpB [Gimesia fumaroli]QDV48596.1 Segregation and condensation protein B [Gimesia fumaroli]
MLSSPSPLNCQQRTSFGIRHSSFSLSQSDAFRWNFLTRLQQGDQLQFASDQEVNTRRSLKMAKVEAVLFVAETALSTRKIAQLATLANAAEAKEMIDQINHALTATNSAFQIKRVATGYQMMTQPQFSFWLNKLHQRQAALKLSSPAMETLAIVVYRQPITRADIESIRGVQSAEMLKQLMERGLVRIGGKDDSLGRPFLYESTRKFLEIFGLKNLDDLPMGDTLRIRPEQKKQAEKTESETEVEAVTPEDEIALESDSVKEASADTPKETDDTENEDLSAA